MAERRRRWHNSSDDSSSEEDNDDFNNYNNDKDNDDNKVVNDDCRRRQSKTREGERCRHRQPRDCQATAGDLVDDIATACLTAMVPRSSSGRQLHPSAQRLSCCSMVAADASCSPVTVYRPGPPALSAGNIRRRPLRPSRVWTRARAVVGRFRGSCSFWPDVLRSSTRVHDSRDCRRPVSTSSALVHGRENTTTSVQGVC